MNTQFVPINIDLIPCAEELHVVPSTGTGGRGIASDPLMIPKGDLDNPGFINLISVKPSIKIVFGDGRFFTNGFGLPLNTCVIVGQGADRTTIQNKDNIDSVLKNRNWPHIRMISDFAQWCLNFGIRDITLDGNVRGQPWFVTNGNSKVEPLVVNSVRGKAERVNIVDFGSHGSKEIYKDGLEAFPLALQTVSMGPPFDKYLPEHKSRGEEPSSFLEISQCRILSATFLGGGYCTGQFVVTNQPGAGDRLPKGARTTLAAWVHDNYVEGINGIAFGCAHAEHVLFERNHAVGNRVGFNCDTGRCENIVLRNNRFIGNSHSANFSPDGGGKGFAFDQNTVIYGPRSTNPITGLPEGYVGLTIGNTLEAASEFNTFVGPADWKDRVFSNYPVLSENDERLIIGGASTPVPSTTTPPSDAALQAVLQANIDLIAERNRLASQVVVLESKSDELTAKVADSILERNAAMDRGVAVISENAKQADAKSVLERLLFEEKQRVLRAEIRESDNSVKLIELEKAVNAYCAATEALAKLKSP